MFLSRIRIANFKSLKDVEINSEGLVALVGPNGSGKTNFALAMKFLSEVHQHGLETAISRAGGFENIAYRKARRSTSPITFEVEVRFNLEQLRRRGILTPFWMRSYGNFDIRHRFACKAHGGSIRADFVVAEETFELQTHPVEGIGGSVRGKSNGFIRRLARDEGGIVKEQTGGDLDTRIRQDFDRPYLLQKEVGIAIEPGKQVLLLETPYHDVFMSILSGFLSQLGVFHFSSDRIRDSGTPTPNPALTMPGGNLPALVDWLQRKHPKTWAGILNAMRDIVPDLQEILVQILPSKTLGLFFSEQGFGRPWTIDEVSDGTIHALSMLVAAADPQTSALVIEEPESSLHPWIIYELAKKLRDLSKNKSIFLTTQSPVVIDTLKPSEVWIVSRRKGKTEISRLTEIDPQIEEDWSEGKIGLSEYLDSGLVPRAVPGGGL